MSRDSWMELDTLKHFLQELLTRHSFYNIICKICKFRFLNHIRKRRRGTKEIQYYIWLLLMHNNDSSRDAASWLHLETCKLWELESIFDIWIFLTTKSSDKISAFTILSQFTLRVSFESNKLCQNLNEDMPIKGGIKVSYLKMSHEGKRYISAQDKCNREGI